MNELGARYGSHISVSLSVRAGVVRRMVKSTASVPESGRPPTWIEPQLTRLAEGSARGHRLAARDQI
jgi:hypothetical protein